MRIAGINVGAARGEVIELSPEKKLEEALKMAASKIPEQNSEFEGFGTWARDIKINEFRFTAQGQLMKGKWANNSYSGSGTVSICRRHLAKDEVHSPKLMEFSINFVDALDSWGMPDLTVTSLDLT